MIRRNGKSWEIRVYAGLRDGKERYVSRSIPAGPKQQNPPKEARDLEARLRTEVGQGHHRDRDVTVAKLLERWVAHIEADRSPLTIRGYRSKIDSYVLPAIGSKRLVKVTTSMLDRLYADLRARGLAPATVRQTHAILRRAFAQAERWGWVTKNPAALCSPPSIPRRTMRLPPPADVGRIVTEANAVPGPLGLLVTLAAGTGARRGEVCGLRWSDIDLDTGTLTIERSVVEIDHQMTVKGTKAGGARTIALGPKVLAALRTRRKEALEAALLCGTSLDRDAYCCSESPDGSAPFSPNAASDRFRVIARRAGVKCRLHDLRHANISHRIAAGIDVRTVSEEAGHSSAKMTLDVYGHAVTEANRQSAEAGEAALG